MARRTIEIGAVGRRVAENLARLREHRRLSQEGLASRVKLLGRPMSGPVISKTEQLDRRIDVDDLVALAVALDTSPNVLLMPGNTSDDEPVELTPEVKVSATDAWKMARGEEALTAVPPPDEPLLTRDDRQRRFIRENHPDNLPEPYFRNVGHDLREYPELFRQLAPVVKKAAERGVNPDSLHRLLDHAIMYQHFGGLDAESHDDHGT